MNNLIVKSDGGVKGVVSLVCRNADGSIKWEMEGNNMIVNGGKALIAALIGGVSSPVAIGYIAVGASNTAVSATQTALLSEITTNGLSRSSLSPSLVTTTTTNDTCRFQHTWTVTGSSTIEEIGLFNANVAGTMLGRKLTGTKSVIAGETLTATYDIIIS